MRRRSRGQVPLWSSWVSDYGNRALGRAIRQAIPLWRGPSTAVRSSQSVSHDWRWVRPSTARFTDISLTARTLFRIGPRSAANGNHQPGRCATGKAPSCSGHGLDQDRRHVRQLHYSQFDRRGGGPRRRTAKRHSRPIYPDRFGKNEDLFVQRCLAEEPSHWCFVPVTWTMEERRKSTRTKVEEIAYISSEGASTLCHVIDISAEGAAISVPNASYVPNRFQLMTKKDRLVRTCVIVWIIKNTIGVKFE